MNDKTISPYEANYEYKYRSYFMGKEISVSLKSRLADLINNDWMYSMHWSKDHNAWVDQAKRDAKSGLQNAMVRVQEMEEALSLLNRVEYISNEEDYE